MSNWVGGNGDSPENGYRGGWGLSANYKVFRKASDMLAPGPSNTFVFLDEKMESLNDGYFVVEMNGFTGGPNSAEEIVDFPASYHHQAGGFAFADGHSEIHKWTDPRVYKPATITLNSTPNSLDVLWMQNHSTRIQ